MGVEHDLFAVPCRVPQSLARIISLPPFLPRPGTACHWCPAFLIFGLLTKLHWAQE